MTGVFLCVQDMCNLGKVLVKQGIEQEISLAFILWTVYTGLNEHKNRILEDFTHENCSNL